MPEEMINRLRNEEHYALAAGIPIPEGPEARKDLFAGLK
jgi:hypothetical protein